MDNTGRQISAGNAAKIAADITIAALQHGIDPDAAVQVWSGILPSVTSQLIAVSESVETPGFTPAAAAPVAAPGVPPAVAAAFPGTTIVAAPAAPAPAQVPTNVVAFPTQPVAAAPQFAQASPFPAGPAAVPGVAPQTDGDPETAQYWTMFFADIASGQSANNWEDNRASKKGEKSPDFKHKSLKDSGGKFKVGLWIKGQKNPSWVAGQLAQLGIS